MKKKLRNKIALVFAFVLLLTAFPVQAAEEQIKVGEKEYAIVLNDAVHAFICNKIPVSGEVGTKVFLTYTVHKVNSDYATTSGVGATTRVEGKFPTTYGGSYWSSSQRKDGGLLFKEGYTYVYRFERTAEGIEYQALKMKDDKVSSIQFTKGNVPNAAYPFYGIWSSGTANDTVNAILTHVRFYDANGNDLGIKSNLGMDKVKVYEDGEADDYNEVAGGYYCEENKKLLVLNDQKVAYIEDEKGNQEVDYKVMYGTQLTLKYPEGKEIWHYAQLKIKDDEDNVYLRLHDAKITFVNGEESFEKQATPENYYRIEKPEDPTKEGDEFLGWCLNNGEEYKFDSLVLESTTLYAKWRSEDGREYLAVGSEMVIPFDYEPVIAISISAIVLVGLVVGYIILVKKRGKQNEKA